MSDDENEKLKKSADAENKTEGQNAGPAPDGEVKEADDKHNTAVHLKTKPLPAIIMLLGGAAVTIDVFVKHFSILNSLTAIFVSLIVFLIIGDIVKMIFDKVELPNQKAVGKDGEMIEKGQGTQNVQSAQTDNNGNAALKGTADQSEKTAGPVNNTEGQ